MSCGTWTAVDDRVSSGAVLLRRRADAYGVHADNHAAAEAEEADWVCDFRDLGNLRTRDRADDRRLSDRKLGLAVHFLRQRRARRDHDRNAFLLFRDQAHEA